VSWFKRCAHEWEEVGRTFTPPVEVGFRVRGFEAAAVLERATHGFTNIEQECRFCGRLDVVTVLGKVDAPESAAQGG
jgi:hypothetical protein